MNKFSLTLLTLLTITLAHAAHGMEVNKSASDSNNNPTTITVPESTGTRFPLQSHRLAMDIMQELDGALAPDFAKIKNCVNEGADLNVHIDSSLAWATSSIFVGDFKKYGLTPLMLVANRIVKADKNEQNKYIELFKFLVDHDADVNAQNDFSRRKTVLMLAARTGNLNTVTLLLKNGGELEELRRKESKTSYFGLFPAELMSTITGYMSGINLTDMSNKTALKHAIEGLEEDIKEKINESQKCPSAASIAFRSNYWNARFKAYEQIIDLLEPLAQKTS